MSKKNTRRIKNESKRILLKNRIGRSASSVPTAQNTKDTSRVKTPPPPDEEDDGVNDDFDKTNVEY